MRMVEWTTILGTRDVVHDGDEAQSSGRGGVSNFLQTQVLRGVFAVGVWLLTYFLLERWRIRIPCTVLSLAITYCTHFQHAFCKG